MHCKKPEIETQDIRDLQIDTLESIPDFFLTERDIVDPHTGDTIRSITRTPGAKVLPNGNLDNIASIEPNNEIDVPEGQVRACRVIQDGSVNKAVLADTAHKAHFLALGTQAGMLLIQNTGFVNIPMTHRYVIGAQYFLGDNGEPTTDDASGQKLFVPISATKLAVNMN